MANLVSNNSANEVLSVTAATAAGSSDPIDLKEFAGGHVLTPASLASATTITWYGCDTRDGTYRAMYDSNNTAVTQAVTANAWHSIHPACNAMYYIKPQMDNSQLELSVTRKSAG